MTDGVDLDKLVDKVSRESGKPREGVLGQMNERKEKTHGLLSDYGAIYAVAKEYGIDLSQREVKLTSLSEVKPTSSVNLCGRVKIVYSAREFTRKDGSKGKFASVILVDKSGERRIVLWDQNADLTKQIRVGDIVLVRNGYAKENRGVVEVHAGPLTNLTVNPSDLEVDLPDVEEELVKVSDLGKDKPSVNLVCRIRSYYPKTDFSRPDGSVGSRASFIAEDESGSVRVVLWDQRATAELKEGTVVKIENGYTREGLNGELELHAGNRSRVIHSDKKIDLPVLPARESSVVQVGDVKSDMTGFTLDGRVLTVYPPREYTGGKGGKLSSLILGDSSGSIRAVLWDDQADVVTELKRGDAVRIRNAYSKANLNDEPEVHVGRYSEVTVNPDSDVPSLGEIEESLITEKKISKLDGVDRNIRLSATVVDVDAERPLVYMTCPSCGKRVQNLGGEWFCEACGDIDADANLVVSLIVEDDSGNVRAVAFKNNAEKILGMDLEEVMNVIGETQDESAPLNQARERIAGKNISLVGRVKYNEFSDQLEFIVNDVLF